MLCSLTLISPRLPPRCWALNHQDQSQNSFNKVSATSALRIVKVSNFKFDVPSRRSHSCKSKLADLATATSAAYGVILLSGGLFAFNRSGSKGSLGGGLTGAAVLATAYFLMQSQETKAIGDALGFGSAFLFSAVFGIRLAATKKFVPAGPLLLLSVGALAVFTAAYLQDSI
ncbi:hypothetical protein K2173_021595 [Erythroxylum novogranatense]|uniref:Uncharacterized protein n=1 Tax=Erythroxylum novogranatense TaxID=1862640 RepID=A0AAV8TN97_9ROSI|nr:hypothetical protein K2173_021595 [Erythroxylum novogranatense]